MSRMKFTCTGIKVCVGASAFIIQKKIIKGLILRCELEESEILESEKHCWIYTCVSRKNFSETAIQNFFLGGDINDGAAL